MTVTYIYNYSVSWLCSIDEDIYFKL